MDRPLLIDVLLDRLALMSPDDFGRLAALTVAASADPDSDWSRASDELERRWMPHGEPQEASAVMDELHRAFTFACRRIGLADPDHGFLTEDQTVAWLGLASAAFAACAGEALRASETAALCAPFWESLGRGARRAA